MRKDGIPQERVGQTSKHRRLNGRHQFACLRPKCRQSQDAIAVGRNQQLDKPTELGKRSHTQYRSHREFYQPIFNPASLGFRFTQSGPDEFGVREYAKRHQPVPGGSLASTQVVTDDAEIVIGDVRKNRTACAIPHRPNVWCRGFESFIDLNIPLRSQFDSSLFQFNSIGIWRSASGNQKIRSFKLLLATAVLEVELHLLARTPLDR